METAQSKIEKISHAHRILMASYVTLLKKLEDKTIRTPFDFDRVNPNQYLNNKQIGRYERFQLIGKLLGYYADKYSDKTTYQHMLKKLRRQSLEQTENRPVKVGIHKRLLTYFFKTHMRTKLVKLHRLYLREIVLQNKGEKNSNEIEQLRTLDSDVIQYIRILPNPVKTLGVLFGSGIGVIGTIIAIIELFDLKSYVLNTLHSLFSGNIIEGYLVAVMLAIPLMTPIIRTFAIKRALLLRTGSWYDYLDIYLDKGFELYKKSIYKLEDELFETLDARGTKPRESPIGSWLQLVVRGPIFAFFSAGMIQKLVDWLIYGHILTSTESITVIIAGIIMSISGFFFFVVPYLEYRRRRNYNLL